MKKSVLAFAVVCALCTTAMAADIAFYVGQWNTDGWYGAEQFDDVATIIDQTGHLFRDIQQFDDDQFDAFGAWVDENSDDGELDIIWLNGCTPSVLYPNPNVEPDGSRIETWLDNGNMVINVGDWFGYCTWEGGSRGSDNGATGAANILDLSSGIIVSADGTQLTVTPTGDQYMPSISSPVKSDRPIALSAVVAPWEVAAVFASTDGTDAGTQADPIVLHNTETDGYIAFVNQASGNAAGWVADRGQACAEFIGNWVNEVVGLGLQPQARSPQPKSGSMIEQTQVVLQWTEGAWAEQHDVYFGTDADAVEAATRDDADLFLGTLATTQVPAATIGELEPGETYYWRVDEINDANAASPWKGNVWSFRVKPLKAWEPFPADGMKNVDPDQDMSWEVGMGSIFHTVYFGTSFDEVNDAVAGGMMTAAASYDPGTLELDTTYYWRADTFAFPANQTYRGDVWSFTTRGEGGGVKAEYFDGMALAGDPIVTQIEPIIDHAWGEGEVAGGLSDLVSARWRGNLEVPFTETYKLIASTDDGVRLWLDGRLVIDDWVDRGTTDSIYNVDLVAGQYYMIQMEYYENGGGAVAQLSWQSDTLSRQIISQGWLQLPLRATGPSPAHLDPAANQSAMLTWIAGDDATAHDVYFGTDADAVANADTATAGIYRGQQAADATSLNPGALTWGQTYYWRVDEVNPDGVLPGALWSFTAADFVVVEDFESFDDNIEAGTTIYQTWIDGFDNGTTSQVGYLESAAGTFGETSIVNGGGQSMPLIYDNSMAPGIAEADRTFSPAQNWTVNGVDTLVIHFRGARDNTGQLYVKINGQKVPYDGDAGDIASTRWIAWEIDLGSVNTNAASVTTLTIGVEGGTAGTVYVDDIRVVKSGS